jgi:hypothetical protein
MKAYSELQTSGNNNVQTAAVPLHADAHNFLSPPSSQKHKAFFENLENQMAALQADHEDTLKAVRQNFVFTPDSSVAQFLTEHRTLPQILLESVPHVRAFFGADAILNLRAPMDESGSQTLYAVVMWPGSVQEVRHHMTGFDDAWWLAHSRQTSGYLNFTYELV